MWKYSKTLVKGILIKIQKIWLIKKKRVLKGQV
jgi:hypothetical protein